MLIHSKWLLRNFSITDNTSCLVFQNSGPFIDYDSVDQASEEQAGEVHHWRYKHDELILDFNNGYSIYRGIITGEKYNGKASNKDGLEWDFQAQLLLVNPSSEQANFTQVALSYQWRIKFYQDNQLRSPVENIAERYISFQKAGQQIYENAEHQAIPSEKQADWVLLDNRLITRMAWKSGRYVSYIFTHQFGQLVGKVKDREGRIYFFRALPYKRLSTFAALAAGEASPFTNSGFDDGKINSIGEYHKYWLVKGSYKNPSFDNYSNHILRLKDSLDWTVQRFFDRLAPMINAKDICFYYVPASTKEKLNTGIRQLAIKLAKHYQCTDATACILRTESIPKATLGGARSREIQFHSLIIAQAALIAGNTVILLDDVTTTGTSLEVCRDLVLVAGAKRVYCLALGKTT